MPKLHEGLAIHKDRLAVVRKVFEETNKVFKNAAHFQGFVKATHYFAADDAAKFDKTEEKKVDETVPGKLSYINEHFTKLLNLDYQMELANQHAASDFIVDGHVVARAVPVNFLLTIENKFREFRDVLDGIPTNAPGIGWEVDTEQSSNREILKGSQTQIDYLTKKMPVYTTIAAATEQHPAQVAASHDDVRVAEVRTTRYTATISPADKSDMLMRCDKIIVAAKRARQRGNNTDLPNTLIAAPILDYITRGGELTGPAAEDLAEI